jgi:hypothetical protein
LAAARATFWFETSMLSASPFSTGSLNSVHHGPRSSVSAGAAAVQPCASLKAAISGELGRW